MTLDEKKEQAELILATSKKALIDTIKKYPNRSADAFIRNIEKNTKLNKKFTMSLVCNVILLFLLYYK